MSRLLLEKFEEKFVLDESGCWIWVGCIVGPDNYRHGWFSGTKASRISWELYRGRIPEGLFVLHKCDNPICVNPDHLFLGTQFDNMEDMTNKGRRAYGDKVANKGIDNPKCKIDVETVIKIREMEGKLPSRAVAKIIGVEKTLILRIWRRKLWAHIP